MTKQVIGIGSAPNDGTGDTLRDAFDKANDNFTELYQSGPTIDLDKYGVSPGNSAATNQAAIANVIESLKSASIPGFHLRLNRAGTFGLTRGTDGAGLALYATRKTAILLPSNCTFECGPDTVLQMAAEESSYILRNDDPVNGNVNIRVIGGQFDGNNGGNGNPEQTVVAGQGYYGMLIWLENINRLYVGDVICRDPGKWAICGTKLRYFTFERPYFDDVFRDGIHLCGDCYDGTILEFRGKTSDNSIAISTAQNISQGQSGGYFGGQFNWADGSLIAGSMGRITIRDAYFEECNGPVALFGRATEQINDITVDNMQGSTGVGSAAAIQISTYPLIGNACVMNRLAFNNIKINCQPGEYAVNVTNTHCKSAQFDNIQANEAGIKLTGEQWETIQVGQISSTAKQPLMRLGDTAGSLPFHAKSIQVNQFTAYGTTANALATIQADANASWDAFSITDFAYEGASTSRLFVSSKTDKRPVNSLRIGTLRCKGGAGVFVGPLDVRVENVELHNQAYLAETNAHVVAGNIDLKGTSRARASSGANVVTGVCQKTLTINFDDADVSVAATTALCQLTNLPRGSKLLSVTFDHSTAFAGGTISNLTLQLRRSGTLMGTAYNAFAAISQARPVKTDLSGDANGEWDSNADPSINILATSSGGNLSLLTAGKATVLIEYQVQGFSH